MTRWNHENFIREFYERPNPHNAQVTDFILNKEEAGKIKSAPASVRQQLEDYVGAAIHLDFQPPTISATIPRNDTVRQMLIGMGLVPDKA